MKLSTTKTVSPVFHLNNKEAKLEMARWLGLGCWSNKVANPVSISTEYCAPVWCRGTHSRLIDPAINDAFRIVSGCLRPTPTDILTGTQPAELRRKGASLL